MMIIRDKMRKLQCDLLENLFEYDDLKLDNYGYKLKSNEPIQNKDDIDVFILDWDSGLCKITVDNKIYQYILDKKIKNTDFHSNTINLMTTLVDNKKQYDQYHTELDKLNKEYTDVEADFDKLEKWEAKYDAIKTKIKSLNEYKTNSINILKNDENFMNAVRMEIQKNYTEKINADYETGFQYGIYGQYKPIIINSMSFKERFRVFGNYLNKEKQEKFNIITKYLLQCNTPFTH